MQNQDLKIYMMAIVVADFFANPEVSSELISSRCELDVQMSETYCDVRVKLYIHRQI